MRISSKTLRRLLVQPPSVPSPMRTPRACISVMRVIPSPRIMFDDGQ